MRLWLCAALLLAATAASADNYVRGYTKSDGTYVEPHYRSEQNSNRSDNYSSQGNTNPYTGQRGSQRNENSDTLGYLATSAFSSSSLAEFGSGIAVKSSPIP